MLPQAPHRKRRTSSKVSLLISLTFHAAIVLGLFYFAAREGLLGKQLKKIAVEMVKEKPPEKPKEKEPEKPNPEEPKPEPAKLAEAPKVAVPQPTAAVPPPAGNVVAPPAVAPPSDGVPSFVFEGGKAVQTTSDPVQLFKGFVEYSLRSNWNRPVDMADLNFVAEVEVTVDRSGQISSPEWKRGSGNPTWDASVRQAIALTKSVGRTPPTNFPPRFLVRFDVQEEAELGGAIRQ